MTAHVVLVVMVKVEMAIAVGVVGVVSPNRRLRGSPCDLALVGGQPSRGNDDTYISDGQGVCIKNSVNRYTVYFLHTHR